MIWSKKVTTTVEVVAAIDSVIEVAVLIVPMHTEQPTSSVIPYGLLCGLFRLDLF